MRHTRIVATVGPATSTPEMLGALIRAGVDIFRLNFSHGTHESHRASIDAIRAAEACGPRVIAIMQDLAGPKIRTGRLAGGQPIALAKGDRLTIRTGDDVGGPGEVFTTYAPLAASVVAGQQLLLDDGRIVLIVDSTDGVAVQTTVVHGTQLGERKGITAPGVTLPSEGLTAKDDGDLRFGIAAGVDIVALSFVQHVSDVRAARAVLEALGTPSTPIVAKLERPQAIDHLDAILAEADAVMVARGDLGLEVPLERVPRLQKEITRRARALGRPVIVATQVLDSMRKEPRPTRAEVSDAANAVDDGVDAIMLAGETASGAFPVESVQTLDAIIRDAEQLAPLAVTSSGRLMHAEHGRALCEAAVTLADRGHAVAIVAVTRGGNTARMLATFRPQVSILAATNRLDVARRLLLYRGVVPIITPFAENVDATGDAIGRELVSRGLLASGDEVVFVSVHEDLRRPAANFLKLHRV
ncbi:MAG: pyruvate kinase [Vicinamibacteria bacterium]|nr:pyruvate kinase [Vicinamibacteria bacterium]